MFWDNSSQLLRVLIAAPIAYASLVLFLRISGKRMLSKLNAFDLVVTIALGSTLATIILSKTVAIAEGLLALTLLLFMQYLMAWGSARSSRFRRVIKSEPTLLYFRGQYLDDALLSENVAREAVRSAARGQGIGDMDAVDAVVLEGDGTLSVLRQAAVEPTATLQDVRNPPAAASSPPRR